jgi:hypothetical protein
MDTHSDRQDDLSPLERRLSGWQPASAGLDADAMLFAAGRAAARPGASRFVWPALTGILSVLVVALSAWLAVERSERLSLAEQLRSQAPVLSPSLVPPVSPTEPTSDDTGMYDSYLSSRRALNDGLEAWPPQPAGKTGLANVPASNPVYQVGHRDILLEP